MPMRILRIEAEGSSIGLSDIVRYIDHPVRPDTLSSSQPLVDGAKLLLQYAAWRLPYISLHTEHGSQALRQHRAV
jgi:hypothetical protein